MNTARKFQSAILLNNGQVLIAGGVGAQNNVLNTAEVYDPSSQSFYVPPTDMQTPRAFATVKLLPDGKVQVIGGDADFSMEIFDPQDGIFNGLAYLPPTPELLRATLSTRGTGIALCVSQSKSAWHNAYARTVGPSRPRRPHHHRIDFAKSGIGRRWHQQRRPGVEFGQFGL
jgi:hypothetical protein